MSRNLPSFEQGYDDTRARLESAREAEHVQAIAEREAELAWGDRPARPDPKPDRRASRREAWDAGKVSLFRRLVLDRDMGCCVHRNPIDCSDGWQAHHVVPAQELRRSRPDALWDHRAGMGVCGLAHRQHHNRVRPIEFAEIPTVAVEYLSGLGFGPWLERHYL